MNNNQLLLIITTILIGIFLNNRLNVFLKEWIAEPLDPKVFPNRKHNKYGNPSGHAQFYSFLFFCLLFFFPQWYPLYIIVFLLYLRTIYVCLTRGYHTIPQLMLGTIVGFTFSCLVYNFFVSLEIKFT